jgi:hypothetical protein
MRVWRLKTQRDKQKIKDYNFLEGLEYELIQRALTSSSISSLPDHESTFRVVILSKYPTFRLLISFAKMLSNKTIRLTLKKIVGSVVSQEFNRMSTFLFRWN